MSGGLRFGIVGPGEIAGVLAESLHRSDAGQVTRVLGRDPGRTAAFCRRHGGAPTTESRELFEAEDVDAVYVATPHPLHAEACLAAFEAGKACLCEKPLTTRPEDTRRVVQAAREARVTLLEAWMYRAHPQIERSLELVASGALGRVLRVESWFGFRARFDAAHRLFDPEQGGGAILDVGGYPLSLAMAVSRAAGHDPRAVIWKDIELERAPNGVDLAARAELLLGGLEARLEVATVRKLGCGARVIGEEGTLHLVDPFLPGGDRHGTVAELAIETADGKRRERVEASEDVYALEVRELARCVRAGELEPRPPFVDHEETIALAEAMSTWQAGDTSA